LTYFITEPIENWTRRTADLLATVTVHTDYTVPVAEVRNELHGLLKETPYWDERGWALQVTDTSENAIQLRALMSARNSSEAWELRCYVREGLVRVINERWPHSLPRLRTEMEFQNGAAGGMQPQPSR
jgi:hypothetical protein